MSVLELLLNIPIWSILVILVLTLVYRYGTQRFGVWESLGVVGPRPWPFIGTAGAMITQGMRVFDQNCVRKYGNIVGLYEGSAPVLLVSDPDILKQVFVKDFGSFMNRTATPLFTDSDNYVFRATLTRLMGDHWKHVRSNLTPTFSTAKLKVMLPQMRDCAAILCDNLQKQATGGAVQIKEFCGAFSMDVIARTAFGLNVDSQNDPDNPFVYHARKVFETSNINIRLLSILLFPVLAKVKSCFGKNQFPPDVVEFFSRITADAMERRKKNNESRVDFLQLMLDGQIDSDLDDPEVPVSNGDVCNGGTPHRRKQGLTHEEILAQSLLFFIAGYETTASTLTYLAYCLATNTTVQDTLRREIHDVTNGRDAITYEMLNDLPYLEMCIQETLRLYPPATRVLRACNKDTVLGEVPVRRGTLIAIPIYTVHHDPDHWPDPEIFKPERFLPAEKSSRNPYVWLPFGAGPRNCIGMRLAMLEVKIAMASILSRMEFHISTETQNPLQFKTNMILTPTEPIQLAVRLRDNNDLTPNI